MQLRAIPYFAMLNKVKTRTVRDHMPPPRINCGSLILLSALVYFWSKGMWSLNHRYHDVEVFHLSYLRNPELTRSIKFQNLISFSLSADTSVVKFSQRPV